DVLSYDRSAGPGQRNQYAAGVAARRPDGARARAPAGAHGRADRLAMKQPGRGRARGQPAGEHTDEIDGGRRQRRPEPVLAKLSPPRLHDVYRRSRLFVQMDRAHRSATATWIAAPGGSGKTTLVASWLQARKLRCAWYRIDRSDADPATFFHHLSL